MLAAVSISRLLPRASHASTPAVSPAGALGDCALPLGPEPMQSCRGLCRSGIRGVPRPLYLPAAEMAEAAHDPARRQGGVAVGDDITTPRAEVISVTELTDWERRRLDALERQLAKEDPRLAARLTASVRTGRTPPGATVRWAMFGVGAVLLLCGLILGFATPIVMAVLLLSTCWVLTPPRRTGGGRSS